MKKLTIATLVTLALGLAVAGCGSSSGGGGGGGGPAKYDAGKFDNAKFE